MMAILANKKIFLSFTVFQNHKMFSFSLFLSIVLGISIPLGLHGVNLPPASQIISELVLLNYSCDLNCSSPIPWDEPQYGCDTNGNVRNNSLCSIGVSYFYCHATLYSPEDQPSSQDWGIQSAGTCECPSDCMMKTQRGKCSNGIGCECMKGYGGNDCGSIVCDGAQKCLGHGECFTSELGFDTCMCESGYSGEDCSSVMIPLEPIPPILPYPQYADDKYGDNHPIFNESVIAQIHLTIDPEILTSLLLPSNADARVYQMANFTFFNGPSVSQSVENVGIHTKGSQSATFAKKSWKVSFNTFDSGRELYGLKKLDLKAASMVPMFVRERASIAAIYAMGAPSPRSSFAHLYINGLSWGAYVMLEDEGRNEYVKSRLGNDKGSLWKVSSSNLSYIGSDPDLYRNPALGYKAENDAAQDDYTPLENFLSILNLTPDDEFEEQIQTVFNVEYFLRTLAAEVLTGNYDGIWNGNNFYLYYNIDDLFYYYRQDLDLAFGANQYERNFANRSVWAWGETGRGQTLINRILAVPSFQKIYASYVANLTRYVNGIESGPFISRMEALHKQIRPLAENDYWHRLDLLFSYQEFEMNMEFDLVRPVKNPMVPQTSYIYDMAAIGFLKERSVTALQQLSQGPPQS